LHFTKTVRKPFAAIERVGGRHHYGAKGGYRPDTPEGKPKRKKKKRSVGNPQNILLRWIGTTWGRPLVSGVEKKENKEAPRSVREIG